MATLGDYLQRFLQLGKQKIASDAVQSGNWLANTVMGKPATYKAAPNPVGQIAREVGQDIVRKAVSTLPQNNTPVMRKVTEASALLNTPPIQATRSYAPVFAQSIKNAIYNKMNPPFVSPIPDVYASEQKIQKPINQTPLEPNRIVIPHRSGKGTFTVPQPVTEALMKTMDPIGEATNAAQMLYHPWSQTFTEQEKKDIGRSNWTFGENPDFKISNVDAPNANGTIDRGLTRINSGTFSGMWNQKNPDGTYPWRQKMIDKGITSYKDMEDLNKNVEMARLILERGNWNSLLKKILDNPSYRQWFAAPLDLRTR